MPTAPSKAGKQKATTGRSAPYKKPSNCLTLCDRFTHDFACPVAKRTHSLLEIQRDYTILRTTSGNTCTPGHYRVPPTTPVNTPAPGNQNHETKLDFGLLHAAILHSCRGKKYRGLQTAEKEEAASALILLSMDGRTRQTYKPTSADILYHELSCRSELTPRASNEEIKEDMELFREAIALQQDVNLLLSIANGSTSVIGREKTPQLSG